MANGTRKRLASPTASDKAPSGIAMNQRRRVIADPDEEDNLE